MSKLVEMDVLCELASEIVERQWNKDHQWSGEHSYIDEAGDLKYIEEVQDEFNKVLDLCDEVLNGDME